LTALFKPLLFIAALVPSVWLAWRLYTANLGVNPAETLQLETGIWTLRFLIITLAVTPLRRLSGWNRVIGYRRMLGLFAFYYAVLHFFSYLALDQVFSLEGMLADVVKRPFITAGFIAFVAMVPLALTSTKGWIRRLGRKWQTLHRLVYVAGAAGAVHYLWKVKVMSGSPVYYALIVAALLGFRGYRAMKRWKSPSMPSQVPQTK
jgi:methionine sulfoxide reductase heme-binding subunit